MSVTTSVVAGPARTTPRALPPPSSLPRRCRRRRTYSTKSTAAAAAAAAATERLTPSAMPRTAPPPPTAAGGCGGCGAGSGCGGRGGGSASSPSPTRKSAKSSSNDPLSAKMPEKLSRRDDDSAAGVVEPSHKSWTPLSSTSLWRGAADNCCEMTSVKRRVWQSVCGEADGRGAQSPWCDPGGGGGCGSAGVAKMV
eukprot:366193-Chlamydomonas_euryale.AAC.4